MLRISMADMRCMFLHRSTQSTNADKALLRDECLEFNNVRMIAVHVCSALQVLCDCVTRQNSRQVQHHGVFVPKEVSQVVEFHLMG